jgi:tetratricopeptide (TPR) repeat protein
MKRAAIVMVVVGLCTLGFAQGDKPAQNAPAGQAAAAPQGKRMPQAKTQPEFEAYKAAMQLADPAAAEKAADDFATKFPDSELRVMVYKNAMERYQQSNNADKMLDMAHKALSYDPDDPEALVGVAQVLAERTRDTDLDKDQKLGEAKKAAERCLVTVDTDIPTTGYPADKLAAYKGYLRSEAYAVLGALASNASQWAEAETDLRKSIEALPDQPDPVAVLRLAIALDKQSKYPEALKYANQAVDLTKDRADSSAGKAAREEQDRLTKLSAGTAPGGAPPKN